MQRILVQYKRLKRHYDLSVQTYDDASLLDLAHILRIWVELKPVLSSINNDFEVKKKFITGSPIRKALKQVKNSQYIFIYLPKSGVKTYASKDQFASGPEIEPGGDFFLDLKVKDTGSSILFEHFCYVSKTPEQAIITAIRHEKIKRCNYSHWLSSETVRLQYRIKTII